MQLFTSQEEYWWTGLLLCFYQLFGLSFWRHPFTAEDPLACKSCNAKFIQNCSHEKTNSSTSWMAWGWLNFRVNYSFNLMQMELGCVGWKYNPNESFIHLQWTYSQHFFLSEPKPIRTKQNNILNGLYFNPSQPWFHLHLLKTVPCLPLQDDRYSLLFLYTLVVLTTDNSDIISSKLTYPFPFKRSGAVRENGFICFVSSWAPLFTPKWDIIKRINKQHMYTYTNMFKTHTKGSEHLYSSYCILVAFMVYKCFNFCNFSFLKC